MNTRTRHLVAAIAAVALAVTASCSIEDPEVITKPDAPKPGATEPAAEPAGEGEEPVPEEPAGPAAVGETITLSGSDNKIAVTVRRIIDPADGGEYSTPDAGNRYVAVELSLHNPAQAVYDDSPSNGITLIDAENREYSSSLSDVVGCADLNGGVTLVEGDTRVGCIPFEVPAGAQLATLQMALDSGFSGVTGQWDLTRNVDPGPPPASTATGIAVGETATLSGSDVEMAVTVTRIIDPAPTDEYSTPTTGHRLVTVEVSLENVGTVAYDDSPGNGATLIDTNYAQQTESFSGTTACAGFAGGTTIAPGDTRVGCLTFEVPEGATPAAFQFALDSGFANEAGRWQLA